MAKLIRFFSLFALAIVTSATQAVTLFNDDWSDGVVLAPTSASPGVDWHVDGGTFSVVNGWLKIEPTSRISVNFGVTAVSSPVEVRFKLFNAWQSGSAYKFIFGLKNTATGFYYEEQATPQPAMYGTSGFHSMVPTGSNPNDWTWGDGDAPGLALSLGYKWDYLKFKFDPNTGVEIYQAASSDGTLGYDNASLAYTKVAHWSNFFNVTSVDQFYMNSGDVLPWFVDNVEIEGTAAPMAATPTFSPDGGSFPRNVIISCETPDATVRYTTDGSDPSESNGTSITSGDSVLVDHALTLKARAWASGYLPSAIRKSEFQTAIFSDNWNDGTVQGPSNSPNGADWAMESGSFGTTAGYLDIASNSRLSVTFGSTKPNVSAEARFKLYNVWQSGSFYKFMFGFKNAATGYYYEEQASPNPGMFGFPSSGFCNIIQTGTAPDGWTWGPVDAPGTTLSTNPGEWNFLKMRFDPIYGVEVWQALSTDGTLAYDDPSLVYTRVAHWSNFFNVATVDQFYLNSGDMLPWYVDDVEIYANIDSAGQACAAPVFSPAGGAFANAQNVVITCSTPDATIRYTTDGSDPTISSGTEIISGASVLVDHTLTLKAKAFAAGYSASVTTSANFKFTLFFRDNFDDKSVFSPASAPAGVDWNVETGQFAADAMNLPAGFIFLSPQSQSLMFASNQQSRISLDFGTTVDNTPLEARLKLLQTTGTASNYKFAFGFKETIDNYYYEEQASPSSMVYGNPPSGFHSMSPLGFGPDGWECGDGDVVGAALSSTIGQWNYIKLSFDPSAGDYGLVEVWQALSSDKNKSFDDPSLTYKRVAHWSNFQYIFKINQFYMENMNPTVSWMVDDVELVGTLESAPEAVARPEFSLDGGTITSANNVVITCATPGATIRYTIDGSVPTQSTGTVIASGASVLVDHSMTLIARAWKNGLAQSSIKIATYTFPSYARPNVIEYADNVTIDGNLSDWSNATWAPIDKTYDGAAGAPVDVPEAYYAAKWGADGDKVFVAVKVRDTDQYFTNSYGSWNGRDAVEIYTHTTGADHVPYGTYQEDAQQYVVGIKSSNHSQVWTSLADRGSVPSSTGFQAAGSVGSGGWVYYEAAMTPFQYFGELAGQSNVISTLQSGDVIGLDVVVAAHSATAYTGMKGENAMTGKSNNYYNFGLHLLDRPISNISIADVKKAPENSVVATTGVISAAFTDFFYIVSIDRTYGIRVNKTAHGKAAGQNVTVTGSVQTLSTGERCISATDVTVGTGGSTVRALGLPNKSLGGGSFGLQAGVFGGTGLSSIGLLVKTTGRVGDKGTGWFVIDDGSGVNVKVYGIVPSGTPYVAVTGASSCEKDGSSNIQRVIWATDVQTVQQ